MPLRWRRKGGSKKSGREEKDGGEKEERQEGTTEPGSSSTASSQMPAITLTTEQDKEEGDDIAEISTEGGRRMKNRQQKMSVTSDGGYSSAASQPSTSTLAVLRPRTLTNSSNDSSMFHTPQGSLVNDPSPTVGGGMMPQYPETVGEVSRVEMMEAMREQLDSLLQLVKNLEILINKRFSMERREREPSVASSMPDLTELPDSPCKTRVMLWLAKKVMAWKFLARWLGLQENEISRIEADHPRSDREQCYQMFLRWKAVDPGNYTYPVLGDVLRKESQELYNEYVKEIHRVESSIDLPVKK
jgi:hypothetical protein